MRTIGIVTTSRADYGIYLPVLKAIKARTGLRAELYVTGSHFDKNLGYTIRAIEKDGFDVMLRLLVKGDSTPQGITKRMAGITAGFGKFFCKRKPDLLLVLGDRYDMHAAALAAVPFAIPLVHLHGGELTYGAFDEYFRHSLTKLSHMHFTSTRVYAKRVCQMGEESWRVIVSGAPGLDNVRQLPLLSKEELTRRFGVDFVKPVILVTFHPATLEYAKTPRHMRALIKALRERTDCQIVFSAPNNDTYGHLILQEIKKFIRMHKNAMLVENFGTQAYMSMLKYATVMVGNSSSGIIEAASFQLPVVNIGTRQDGRVKPKNVIDCGYEESEISRAMTKALSLVFRKRLKGMVNPYGTGQAAKVIVKTLASLKTARLIPKTFIDR